MSNSILTLSGWAQPADALNHALNLDSTAFDYSDYPNAALAIEALRAHAHTPHIIAWSLGGQLAVRAIAAGALHPSHVTLIASPYQFVSDDAFSGGMDPLTFTQFRASYARDAARTKERFKALVAKGDSKFREVAQQLQHHPMVEDTNRWLPWLDALGQYSQRTVPPIANNIALQVIHGTEDAITPIAQAEAWQTHHPHIRVHRVVGAGHAPHLHDAQSLRSLIMHHHGVPTA